MFNAISIHRVAHWLYRHKAPVFPHVLQILIFLLFNSYIPYQLSIGSRSRLGHRGVGVVINKEAIVGSDVLIRAHVTIGKKHSNGPAPVIGNKVEIGDGAKILGGVSVGDNAVIGANAVVTKDVPPNSIAIGIPAKIVEKKLK